MAEPTKSAVFFDYESLHRSLADAGLAETRLADRAAAWLAAIEKGRLIGPRGTRRRFLVRRCYAGGAVLGKQRDALAAAGFEVVDTNTQDGGRNAADLHLAMDIIDALSQPNGAEEFILLTADAELGPLLTRLKASKRQTVIYADKATPARDKALCDGILDKTELAEFLDSNEVPEGEAMSSGSPSDRAEIEAFARRIHAATNIPLFSPKTFAELFKHLTDEIREHGYHFQTTAKNVADRMTETGRNVTRRQVVFIVKGLALKGHVFSDDDTPDDLAEVFREQARYLITNAGITLDARQDQLLSAWFVSRAPAPPPLRPKPITNGATPPPPPAAAVKTEARKPAEPVTPAPPPAPPSAPPRQAVQTTTPQPPPIAAKPVAPIVRAVDLPKSSAKPAPPPLRLAPSQAAREEARAIIAARIAASAKLRPAPKPATTPKPNAKPANAGKNAPPPSKRAADPTADALESSILAAIAEAVDVLVDDRGHDDEVIVPEPQQSKRKVSAEPEVEPPQSAPAPSEHDAEEQADGGDIGDQIQRIIASYNRNRTDE